jgi:phage repressor protein C with HTH and peptisase S24 domain
MSALYERLGFAFKREQERRKNAGEPKLTRTMLWKAAGVTSGAYSQWQNGNTGMTLDNCFGIAPLLRVNPHWLFDESSPMDAPYSKKTAVGSGAYAVDSGGMVAEQEKSMSIQGVVRFEKHPVSISAGPGAVANTYNQDEIDFIEVAEWWAREFVGSTDSKRIKVVPCRGASMSPTIPDGSILFVDVKVREHIGDGIYCIDLENRLLVKRINIRVRDHVLEVVSDNKNGPPTETYPLSEEKNICICGKVVAWLAIQKDG